MGPGLLIALFFIGFVFLVIFFRFIPIGLWVTAWASGVHVSFLTLFGMRFRKVNPAAIVSPLINAHKAGLQLTPNDLEAHYLAGGNVERVVRALISADKAGIPLPFKQAAAIDLAGRDVFEAVQVSVNPKVITTPKVAAMAKDGIQLLALARVTVRANINRLVGGAGEETILARVGEGIVSTIGSATSHKAVLENPDLISKTVLAKGLDAGTAFEILSIDIADVDVGKNIGAELQTDQAEADKRIAQAKAEERRAMAVAVEQEYKAETQAQRAKLIAAEAQIPLAIADALRSGNLGAMDYQRYKNIQADTTMRQAIAGQSDAASGSGS
ncbi:MAG: flotillin-like protein FloA [Gemmatimonadales bacterium]